MKLDGMPLSSATRSAASLWYCTKSSRPLGAGPMGAAGVADAALRAAGRARLSVEGETRFTSPPMSCCASWREIASDSPPGRPDICTDSCWSSRSAPRSPWGLSSRPDFMVASRMLLIISRMNSDSNCFAASLVASGLFWPA